jgi:hypothetical protein
MIYRRLINTTVWHFSPRCSAWPGESYEERQERPAYDPRDLCGECTALLLRMGRCREKLPDKKD